MPTRNNKKPVPIRLDAHIKDLLEICLDNFFGKSEDRHNRIITATANVLWLLERLAESPQFSQEQKDLFKQLYTTWNDGIFSTPESAGEEG
jgi:hypothetical protein